MSRRGSAKPSGIQLFPFLAVLICTMGALVVLLHAFAQHGRMQAIKVAEAKARANQDDDAIDADFFKWRIGHLKEAREKTQAQLADERLKLSHVEDHERRLRDQLENLKLAAAELEKSGQSTSQQGEAVAAEVAATEAKLAKARDEVAAARSKPKGESVNYSIIPYRGRNGTDRRPIYIECREDVIILQPEGVRITPQDFMGFYGPGNPLATALRAQREYFALVGHDGEPYPLLLVRPDGVKTYYVARVALDSWGSDFGYELVGADWELKFPERDARLASLTERVIDEARARQRAYVMSSPLARRRSQPKYRASARGGFAQVPGTSEADTDMGAWDDYDYADAEPGSFGRGGGAYPGGDGGESAGPGDGPGGNGYSLDGPKGGGYPRGGYPGGEYPGGKGSGGEYPEGGYANAQGRGGAEFGEGGGAGGGSRGPRGENIGGEGGLASDGSLRPGGPRGGGDAGSRGGERGDGLADPYGDEGIDWKHRQPGTGMAGGTGPRGAGGQRGGGGSTGGDSEGYSSTPGQRDVDGQAVDSQRPQVGGGAPPPSHIGAGSPAPHVPPGHRSARSMASTRGEDWGLNGASIGAIAASRPILVKCYSDKLVVVPETRTQQPREIRLGPHTEDAMDDLVSAVQDHMEVWGKAGRGLYWRPTLTMDIEPGAETRFAEIKSLLANSGLDVNQRHGAAAPAVRSTTRPSPRR